MNFGVLGCEVVFRGRWVVFWSVGCWVVFWGCCGVGLYFGGVGLLGYISGVLGVVCVLQSNETTSGSAFPATTALVRTPHPS